MSIKVYPKAEDGYKHVVNQRSDVYPLCKAENVMVWRLADGIELVESIDSPDICPKCRKRFKTLTTQMYPVLRDLKKGCFATFAGGSPHVVGNRDLGLKGYKLPVGLYDFMKSQGYLSHGVVRDDWNDYSPIDSWIELKGVNLVSGMMYLPLPYNPEIEMSVAV